MYFINMHNCICFLDDIMVIQENAPIIIDDVMA